MDRHAERMQRFRDAGLYLVTSAELSAGRPTLAIVEAALRAGVRLIQLREKQMTLAELWPLALEVRQRTDAAGALLLINDRVDLAMAVGADGVHLGRADFPVAAARQLAPDLIIGASTHTPEDLRAAAVAGASYVNIGPIFPTPTKPEATRTLGLDGLREMAAVADLPFTVMGGIKRGHLPALAAAGARTVAVVTAVTAAPDPEAAARDLLECIHAERKH